MIKKTLKSLCCGNGWCYGVFWGFDQRNSLLLTFKDAYYEEQMRTLINSILLQAHFLERGAIGQAAFTKKDRWMYSDVYHEGRNFLGSFDGLEAFQEDSEFFCQFAMGIKTIAVIPVEPWGVVELGSTQKNPETEEFIDQVRELFREMDAYPEIEISENEPHSDCQFFYSSARLNSSGGISHNVDQNMKSGPYFEGLTEAEHSLVLPSQSFRSTSDHQCRNMVFPAASLVDNPLQLDSGDLIDCLATQAISNGHCSLLTSWPHLASGLEDSTSFSKPRDYESCRNSSSNTTVSFASTSLQAQQFSNDMLNAQKFTSSLSPTECKAQRASCLTLDEVFQGSNFAEFISKLGLEEDLSQCFSPQLGSTPFTTLPNKDNSHTTGLIRALSSSENTPMHKSESLPTDSLQSSVTDVLRSSQEVKCSGVDKLLDTLRFEPRRKKPMGWNETPMKKPMGWNESPIPLVNGDGLNFSTDLSECITEKHVGSKTCTSSSLFSKLGIDQLLDGIFSSRPCSFAKSKVEDQLSSATKRRKIDNFSWSHNQVKLEDLPSFDRKMKSLNPAYDTSSMEPWSCVGDICTVDVGKISSSRMQVEQAKTRTKKAKLPRPKDRQMIQDRLAELRELIPNGEKMSIDRLLERTIRHLNFIQNLTKHAASLKQIDKPKSGEIQNNHSTNGGGGGVTWACEVGDQNMVCPLIVEDLNTPGQMLIEMLCVEQGFFLEIVDTIRGFGLTILKGVMQVRETKKIWAHFMVEAEGNRRVSRHDIFSSLIQLVQMTGHSAGNASDSYSNVMSSGMPALNNFQPSASFLVNFSDALQCASL